MKAGWLIDAAARRSALVDQLDCPHTEIKDRICEGYLSNIRSFIYSLGQDICPQSLWAIWHSAKFVSGATMCSSNATTLDKYFDGLPEAETEQKQGQDTLKTETEGLAELLDDSEDSHKVLDEIDLNEWEIACGYEDAPADAKFGLIYDRYSSDNQNETGCVSRVKSMLDEAAEREVYLYSDPIVDTAETGKNVDRKGLERMVQLMQHPQIEYLFLFEVARLSRWNSFSIFLVDVLTRKLDVTVVTSDGPLDLDRLEGLAMTWVSGMSSEITNRNKARNTLGGQIETFKDGNYTSWFRTIPIGYEDSNDELLEVDSDEIELVNAIFRTFKHAEFYRAYAVTRRIINEHYEHVLDEPLSRSQLRRMIRDPIYIGTPTVEGESIGDQGQKAVVEEPNLKIIDEKLFGEVNEKADRIQEKYTGPSKAGEVMDLDYLLSEFGILPVMESSTRVQVPCPSCNSQMVRDRPYELANDERMAVTYRCLICEEEKGADEEKTGCHKTFPNSHELYKIKLFDYILENINEVAQHIDLDEI
ncbi:recombinase family protein [Natrialbaceae archaeon A-CW3]